MLSRWDASAFQPTLPTVNSNPFVLKSCSDALQKNVQKVNICEVPVSEWSKG